MLFRRNHTKALLNNGLSSGKFKNEVSEVKCCTFDFNDFRAAVTGRQQNLT